VLPAKLALPPYTAVIECFPLLSSEVDNDAWPPLRDIVPSDVAPSKNCTVPVAVEGDTVAAKVTWDPLLDGLELDVNAVVVWALFTVCDSGKEALLEWLPSPLYCAVME
jgi:hypothetical protein